MWVVKHFVVPFFGRFPRIKEKPCRVNERRSLPELVAYVDK